MVFGTRYGTGCTRTPRSQRALDQHRPQLDEDHLQERPTIGSSFGRAQGPATEATRRRGDSPTEPRPGRREQEFEPAGPPSGHRQRLCSHLLCPQIFSLCPVASERRIFSRVFTRESPRARTDPNNYGRDAAPPRRPGRHLQAGPTSDSAPTHRHQGPQLRSPPSGPCSSTQSVDTSVKSVIGLRHQPVWSPPPCCSGHGRELSHLARPQPVRRPDLAHVNLGGGNAMPRQQIDKLASQPLNVA